MPESGRGFTRNAVVQREKGVAEHPERVFGSQGAVVDEHFELLLKAVYGQGGELVCGGVDVGEVVPGLPVVCAAGQCQAAVRARSGEEGGGEAALGYRESDADVAGVAVGVGGVDADHDWLVIVGEGPDPATNRYRAVDAADGVDPAADPPLRLALVHRDAGLPQRARDRSAVQEVTGPNPQTPLRDDVQGEACGVFVELPHERVDLAGVER